jgi:toxin ParE1/3/4
MAEYRLSSRAAADLAEIADYGIEQFGIEQARQYRDGLAACFQNLADRPKLGRRAEDLAPALRRYAYQSHVVFYLPEGEGIRIVRVLHQSRDFERHL